MRRTDRFETLRGSGWSKKDIPGLHNGGSLKFPHVLKSGSLMESTESNPEIHTKLLSTFN